MFARGQRGPGKKFLGGSGLSGRFVSAVLSACTLQHITSLILLLWGPLAERECLSTEQQAEAIESLIHISEPSSSGAVLLLWRVRLIFIVVFRSTRVLALVTRRRVNLIALLT
jgi:hypothetical protein